MARRPARSTRQPKKSWLPVLLATSLGLGAGLALSSPLAHLIRGQGTVRPSSPAWSNPFNAWINFGQQDFLILGTDVGEETQM